MSIPTSLQTHYTRQDQPFTVTLPGWTRPMLVQSIQGAIRSAQADPERGLICPNRGHIAHLLREYGTNAPLEILSPASAISMTQWRGTELLYLGFHIAPQETLTALDQMDWAGLIDGGLLNQWITRDPDMLAELIRMLPGGSVGVAAATLLDGIRSLWRHAVDARLDEPNRIALLQAPLTAAAQHAQADALFVHLATAEAIAHRPDAAFLRALAQHKVPAHGIWQQLQTAWPARWQAASLAARSLLAVPNGPVLPDGLVTALAEQIADLAETVMSVRYKCPWHPWFAQCLLQTTNPQNSWQQLFDAAARARFMAQHPRMDDAILRRAREICAFLDFLAQSVLASGCTDNALCAAVQTYREQYRLRQLAS